MKLFCCFNPQNEDCNLHEEADGRLSSQLMVQYQLLLQVKLVKADYQHILDSDRFNNEQKRFASYLLVMMAAILDAKSADVPHLLSQFNSFITIGGELADTLNHAFSEFRAKVENKQQIQAIAMDKLTQHIADHSESVKHDALRSSILMMSEDFASGRQCQESGLNELKRLAREGNATSEGLLAKAAAVQAYFQKKYNSHLNGMSVINVFKPKYYLKHLTMLVQQYKKRDLRKKMEMFCANPLCKSWVSDVLALFRDQGDPIIKELTVMASDQRVTAVELWRRMSEISHRHYAKRTQFEYVGVATFLQEILTAPPGLLDRYSALKVDNDLKSRIEYDLLNTKTQRVDLRLKLLDSLKHDTIYQFSVKLSFAVHAINAEGESFDYAAGSSFYEVLSNAWHNYKLADLIKAPSMSVQEQASRDQRCEAALRILGRCTTGRVSARDRLLTHCKNDSRQRFGMRLNSTLRQIEGDYWIPLFAFRSRLYRSVVRAVAILEGEVKPESGDGASLKVRL